MKLANLEPAYAAQQRRKYLLQVLDALPREAHPQVREALAWRISIESGRLRDMGFEFVDPPEVDSFVKQGEPMQAPVARDKP